MPSNSPVTVAIVGTGSGGANIPNNTRATTPSNATPDLLIQVVSPLLAIGIRFANTFFTTLVGLIVAAMTPAGGALLYTGDFFHLVITCSSLAVPGAALGLIKDLVTIFGKLEGKYPLLTGSV